MTSYKNVVKYEYTQNPTDVVALREYMLFDDGKDKGKYAILKFINNLDQKLYAVQFEAQQYDADGGLIAKTLVVYDRFTADPGETFVPKAKLRLSANCAQISVKLLSARFDRVRWEKGNFMGNSYPFKRFVQDEGRDNAAEAKARASAPKTKEAAPSAQTNGKKTVSFRAGNIYRENFATFPQVFAVFMVLLVLGFTVATCVLTRRTSKEFSVGDFDVIATSSATVSVVGYDGKSKDVVIPAKIGDYTVTKIATGAFKKSKIKSVTIEADNVTIAARAFEKCKSLTAVRASALSNIQVLGYAFDKCTEITTINMPSAVVAANGFNGSDKVTSLRIGSTTAQQMSDIFGTDKAE